MVLIYRSVDKYFADNTEQSDFVNRPVGTATLATLRATQTQLEKIAKQMAKLEADNADLRKENEALKLRIVESQAASSQAAYISTLESHVERLEKQVKEMSMGSQRSVSTYSSRLDSPPTTGRSLRAEMQQNGHVAKPVFPLSPTMSRSSSIFSSNRDVEQMFEQEYKDDASSDGLQYRSKYAWSPKAARGSIGSGRYSSPQHTPSPLADFKIARETKQRNPHEKPFVPAGRLSGSTHDPYLRIPLHVRAATRKNPADSKPRITVTLD